MSFTQSLAINLMKTQKQQKSTLMAFYQGGTKFKVALTMTVEEVEKEVAAAKLNNRPAKLETVNEDPFVDDEFLYMKQEGLMFYNLSTLAAPSIVKV